MKASIEWLKEYSNINKTAIELGDILTLTGSKVETIESKGKDIKNVVIGKILEIEKHPDADKLVITKVNIGEEIIQIVTGAKNISVGDVIPVAKDGSELPGGVKIKKGMLRGIESCGMMCSISELGLTLEECPDQISDGIMILGDEYEKFIGENVVEILGLEEEIIDFEITSNRPDCFSIEGLGRETALSLKEEFKNPRKNLSEIKIEKRNEIEGLKASIEAEDLCYRYIARVVKNVKIGPSPKWMVRRLKACGIRSVNNIVDITNYVMLELGQPMHAFDINSIDGKSIIVRRANNGEKIITLDEQERILNENNLVIADQNKAVAIAGVMGGLNSEIKGDTETIVFEAAVFYGGSVRKTAKSVGLRTEASSRFEKGLSPENALRAINRAIELVSELGAGNPVDGMIDVYPKKQEGVKVEFDVNRINNLLGTKIPETEMIEILQKLEMKVEDGFVIPPYFRNDIERVADLAEEVVRFYGYDKLETTLINSDTTLGIRNKEQKIEDRIKEVLVNSGLSEIYTYGFLNKKDLERANILEDNALQDLIIPVKNPLSEDFNIMRVTTIPSMMNIISTNINKKNENVGLFEIAKTYKNVDGNIEKGEVPQEDKILTIGMYGDLVDFYSLKGMIEKVLESISVNRYDIEKESNNPSYHPGRTANLKIGIDNIATFGEVHPIVLHNYDISKRIYIAELNITKIVKYSKTNKKYTEVPKFPAVERDIAVIVDEEITVGQIEKIIEKKAKKSLESMKLFDIYRGERLGENKKSLAFSLIFREKSRTLNDEEITKLLNDIIQELEKNVNAELRK